jgi:hypothetical protein
MFTKILIMQFQDGTVSHEYYTKRDSMTRILKELRAELKFRGGAIEMATLFNGSEMPSVLGVQSPHTGKFEFTHAALTFT